MLTHKITFLCKGRKLCYTIQYAFLRRLTARDLHPLANAHAERTKKWYISKLLDTYHLFYFSWRDTFTVPSIRSAIFDFLFQIIVSVILFNKYITNYGATSIHEDLFVAVMLAQFTPDMYALEVPSVTIFQFAVLQFL